MDFRHLLEQAKNLERAIAELDERLRDHETSATAGSGAVEVRMNGVGDVLSLRIDPALVATGDAGLVSQTVLAALRQAAQASRTYREEQRAQLSGGLKLPEF